MDITLSQLEDLGLSFKSEFIPYSKSRSFNKDASTLQKTLNYSVTLSYKDREVLTTLYTEGIGKCPGYKSEMHRFLCMDDANMLNRIVENGQYYKNLKWTKITPNYIDFMFCMLIDARVLDYNNFENWANNVGFNSDSISDKKMYDESLVTAIQLKNGIDNIVLEELKELVKEY